MINMSFLKIMEWRTDFLRIRQGVKKAKRRRYAVNLFYKDSRAGYLIQGHLISYCDL